jgi:DNA-binding CsgD family transcriptional regulator/tetratricopeptide (TPR) repeat protein
MVLSRPPAPATHGGVRVRRATSSVVGRTTEIGAIEEAVDEARQGIAGLSLEGEPGIGKSRLLHAAAEMAAAHGFATVAVAGDEEIRGALIIARGIFASDSLRDGASERAVKALDHACDVLSGVDESGLGGLAPDDRLLRVIDQATIALRMTALERPIALLLDDMQWADQDSLRLLRYVIRTQPTLPLFFAIAIRPEESALTQELVTLLADMDRMGLIRRIRLTRFRHPETAELLRQVLAGPVAPATVAAIQAQAEGVPFVIEELARTYREAGLVQHIEGSWTISPKAGRLVPSSVRTLVQRRAAHLKDDTRGVLAEAAILGRNFRLADVCAIRSEMGQSDCTAGALADMLAPAVEAGLISSAGDRAGADFSFNHQQIHEFAASWLPPARRRAIHAAIVELLSADEHLNPANLSVLARHALAAEDLDRSARYSVEAARAALAANAPEEALRLIDEALAVVSARLDRVALLRIRDDAFDMLRRVDDRLEGLTELAALAEAAGDTPLIWEVMLRRAAALRLDGQCDRAADLARTVRGRAAEKDDKRIELAACLELGQDLMRAAIGESFSATPFEVDFDGTEEAYSRAVELAEALDDKPSLAAAQRELGVLGNSRVRAWFVERFKAGEHIGILRQVAAGGRLADISSTLPIYPVVQESMKHLQKALELFEDLGDRRGAMSAIITMAYLSWAPDVHVGASPARRIEEIRRLATQMQALSRESERAAAEAQMLFGVHVFCRSKVIPDLAVARGRETHEAARRLGDRSLEFFAAGGTACAYAELGQFEESKAWLDRAGAVATSAPTPARARNLEYWRGLLAAKFGDLEGMEQHLGQALDMATSQDRRAARGEILASYALEIARHGAETGDESLLERAERMAQETERVVAELPGRPPWGAQAEAALATVALARGDRAAALEHARSALGERRDALREDPHLEILLPAARVILALGDEAEQTELRDELQLLQALIGQRTLDSETRAQWFKARDGRELAELAGTPAPSLVAAETAAVSGEAATNGQRDAASPSADERQLLGLLIEGRTNAEIAAEIGTTPDSVAQSLAAMYVRIGASSRAEATVMALSGRV